MWLHNDQTLVISKNKMSKPQLLKIRLQVQKAVGVNEIITQLIRRKSQTTFYEVF